MGRAVEWKPAVMNLDLLNEVDDSRRPLYRLRDDYTFAIGPGSIVTVPAGYITNLGSVPRFAWWFVSPGELRQPSVIHDYLCNEDFGAHTKSGYSRFMADAIFYEALLRFGWPKWKATIVFWTVRSWARFRHGMKIHGI